MSDPYFDDVVLLLHCNGTDASTTIVDDSSYGQTCNANGNAQLDTAQKLFGSASILFDGSGDYVTAGAETILGTGDWTIEFAVRFNSLPTADDENDGVFAFFDDDSKGFAISFQAYSSNVKPHSWWWDGFNWSRSSYDIDHTITTGQWYRYRFTWDGTYLALWVDGVYQYRIDNTGIAALSHNRAEIGRANPFGETINSFDGWLDEIRITVGVARSTGTGNYTLDEDEFEGDALLLTAGATTQKNQSQGNYVSKSPNDCVVGTSTQKNQSPSAPVGYLSTLPIGIDCAPSDQSGLIIYINPYRSGTSTLPIGVGRYTGSSSLPIEINPRFSGTSTLPIGIYPEIAAESAADFVSWQPVVTLNGADISSKLVGQIMVGFSESAASIAEFSYLPAAGTIDPLTLCGKKVTITWRQTGPIDRLMFTGTVSDPLWTADNRLMTLTCSGDLQQRIDAMTKAQIRTQFAAGVWSDMVFGQEDDLSGWDYAQDLLSTTEYVVWQDAAGSIRTSSILAKVSADYTYTDASRFSDTLTLQFAQRSDLVNEVQIRTDYQYNRRRERTVSFSWQPYDLTVCSWLVDGFELPQRSMIESAANSGGWAVIGNISYTPVWPGGWYPCLGGGEAIGFVNNPAVTGEFCIGAYWRAARRWIQSVTEKHGLVVRATDSISSAGRLIVSEQYGFESESDDETWETSLEYTQNMSGAGVWSVGGSGDLAENLDTDRADFEAGQEVALRRAKYDILRSHRGTTVTFESVFLPMLDLSHTVAISGAYLDCKGKVSAITHVLDIDSGSAISRVGLSLSRRNGSGTVSDDPLTAPAEPTAPDEMAPDKTFQLGFHLGGNEAKSLPYSESWESPGAYITNYTANTSWQTSDFNPAAVALRYTEGFFVTYPDIDSTYTNEANEPGAVIYEVDVPEDDLTITA